MRHSRPRVAIGDEPLVTIQFAGMNGWPQPAEARERFVATLLVRDIVDGMKVAGGLGDAASIEALAKHT